MKIALELSDGRQAADSLAQVTVANAHGEPVMAAYHGPAGSIVCGHHGEDGWTQFLEDTGILEKIHVGERQVVMVAKIVPITGSVSVVPVRRVVVYSDAGDPVIAAIQAQRSIDTLHAGDRYWSDFCKQHEIYVPRATIVQDVG